MWERAFSSQHWDLVDKHVDVPDNTNGPFSDIGVVLRDLESVRGLCGSVLSEASSPPDTRLLPILAQNPPLGFSNALVSHFIHVLPQE